MNTIKKTIRGGEDAKFSMKGKLSLFWFTHLEIMRYCFLIIIAAILYFGQPLIAQDGGRRNLVSVNWLEKNLKNPDVVLLDASPSQIYTMKHIPGAINYDIFVYGAKELPTVEIEKRYQSWGISPGKKIIIYDQGGTIFATRLFFSLDYYGFPTKNIFIVDGGLSKWQEAGLPVTKEPTPVPKKGSFTIKKLNEDVKVDLPEFLNASGDTRNNVLLEALDAGWHFGGTQFFSRPGHIPNAIMLPSADFFNPDKTFKSNEEIKKMLNYLEISHEQKVYTHCGGGIAASVPFFAMKFLLDYTKVKLYLGSQLEWVLDQRELPLWTFDAPFLMRETSWLKTWGGKMMRMYGVSKVSIVDVRSEETFNQGHFPLAINIPAEVFKSNITDNGKLAKILGRAGVNSSYEAVIISGSGLTKESALAFVLMEKLGQKKISIFMDSLSKAVKLGYTMIKDTTISGSPKNPNGLSILAMDYPENFRNEVIIADPIGSKGVYPKVFIASGKNVPTITTDSTIIHMPYTNLMNVDGNPKAAKEIWDILTKAGVPRYAEIICISDDPGEAAVNYFIFKLMGYPDIKMLVM